MADEEETNIPQDVKELTDISFANWKHHPMTQLFHRFLIDSKEQLKKGHMERWEANSATDPAFEAKAHARIEQITELVTLTVEDIHMLYGYVPPEESNVEKETKK